MVSDRTKGWRGRIGRSGWTGQVTHSQQRGGKELQSRGLWAQEQIARNFVPLAADASSAELLGTVGHWGGHSGYNGFIESVVSAFDKALVDGRFGNLSQERWLAESAGKINGLVSYLKVELSSFDTALKLHSTDIGPVTLDSSPLWEVMKGRFDPSTLEFKAAISQHSAFSIDPLMLDATPGSGTALDLSRSLVGEARISALAAEAAVTSRPISATFADYLRVTDPTTGKPYARVLIAGAAVGIVSVGALALDAKTTAARAAEARDNGDELGYYDEWAKFAARASLGWAGFEQGAAVFSFAGPIPAFVGGVIVGATYAHLGEAGVGSMSSAMSELIDAYKAYASTPANPYYPPAKSWEDFPNEWEIQKVKPTIDQIALGEVDFQQRPAIEQAAMAGILLGASAPLDLSSLDEIDFDLNASETARIVARHVDQSQTQISIDTSNSYEWASKSITTRDGEAVKYEAVTDNGTTVTRTRNAGVAATDANAWRTTVKRPEGGEIAGANIGLAFGSSLGQALGGSNPFARIAAGTVLGALTANVGAAFGRALDKDIDLETAFEETAGTFNTNLATAFRSQVVGAASSFLTGELMGALGVGSSFGGTVLGSVGGAIGAALKGATISTQRGVAANDNDPPSCYRVA